MMIPNTGPSISVESAERDVREGPLLSAISESRSDYLCPPFLCRLLSRNKTHRVAHAGRSGALETVVATEVHTPTRVALRLILRKR